MQALEAQGLPFKAESFFYAQYDPPFRLTGRSGLEALPDTRWRQVLGSLSVPARGVLSASKLCHAAATVEGDGITLHSRWSVADSHVRALVCRHNEVWFAAEEAQALVQQ